MEISGGATHLLIEASRSTPASAPTWLAGSGSFRKPRRPRSRRQGPRNSRQRPYAVEQSYSGQQAQAAPQKPQESESPAKNSGAGDRDWPVDRRRETTGVTAYWEARKGARPVGSWLPETVVPEPSGRSHGLHRRSPNAGASYGCSRRPPHRFGRRLIGILVVEQESGPYELTLTRTGLATLFLIFLKLSFAFFSTFSCPQYLIQCILLYYTSGWPSHC